MERRIFETYSILKIYFILILKIILFTFYSFFNFYRSNIEKNQIKNIDGRLNARLEFQNNLSLESKKNENNIKSFSLSDKNDNKTEIFSYLKRRILETYSILKVYFILI